ncbi:MAG: integrin alpha [Pseudomonadota bacterium]
MAVGMLGLMACLKDAPDSLAAGKFQILEGERPGARFGASGDWIGDFNKDGFADAVIGAPEDLQGGAGAGRAYVYYGSASDPALILQATLAGGPGDGVGVSVAGLGDVNGDGFDDFAVASRGASQLGISNEGAVFVFFGTADGLLRAGDEKTSGVRAAGTADVVILDDASGGTAHDLVVASAGDLDQNGQLDLAVANPAAGRVYIFLNGSQFPRSGRIFTSQADLTLTGEAASDGFGSAMGAVLDVNAQDSVLKNSRFGDDFAIGAPSAQGKGAVYLILGSQGLPRGTRPVTDVASQVYRGSRSGDLFGTSIAGVGDFDGDGVDDFAIGAPGNDSGRVEIYFGQAIAGPSPLTPAVFSGESVGDRFGASVSGMLPVQFAATPELVAGADQNDFGQTDAGAVYLMSKRLFVSDASLRGVTGSASFADRKIRNPLSGLGPNLKMGTFVRAGLDVNGDGSGDLLAGVPGSPEGGADTGAVLVAW